MLSIWVSDHKKKKKWSKTEEQGDVFNPIGICLEDVTCLEYSLVLPIVTVMVKMGGHLLGLTAKHYQYVFMYFYGVSWRYKLKYQVQAK